ncbi:MAG: hypothetical protein JXR07_07160 [Reichenbachiella sp.]
MKKSNRRAILGALFIAIGVLFLLDNLAYLDFRIPYYLLTWQMILVAIGGFQLITGNKRGGLILLTVGIVFWLPEYFDIRFRDYWPIILIAIGLGFFMRSRVVQNSDDDADDIDDVAILAGSHKKINNKQFSGGRLSAVMGGIELDLRQASLHNGKATIDSFTVMGGVKLFVPDDWVINFEATNILGGFKDKRAHKPTEYFGNVLTIKGLIVMGGVELNS